MLLSSSFSLGLMRVTLAPASNSRLALSAASPSPPITRQARSLTSRLIWNPNFMCFSSSHIAEYSRILPYRSNAGKYVVPGAHVGYNPAVNKKLAVPFIFVGIVLLAGIAAWQRILHGGK